MRVTVVYESFYGNTRQIAEAVRDGISQALASQASDAADETVTRIELLDVTDLGTAGLSGRVGNGDLLIVGSPTRAFSPTEAVSGLLKALPRNALSGVKAAAFDTRVHEQDISSGAVRFMVRLFGYAAPKMQRRIAACGARVIGTEGFLVAGNEGPLRDGEIERARGWAESFVNA